MERCSRISAAAVRMLCIAALMLLGLAHAPVAALSYPADNQIAYVLPDGSTPVLCQASPGRDGKMMMKPGCEVCRLAASIALPVPGDAAYLLARHASVDNPHLTRPVVAVTLPIDRPKSRAPPLSA